MADGFVMADDSEFNYRIFWPLRPCEIADSSRRNAAQKRSGLRFVFYKTQWL